MAKNKIFRTIWLFIPKNKINNTNTDSIKPLSLKKFKIKTLPFLL